MHRIFWLFSLLLLLAGSAFAQDSDEVDSMAWKSYDTADLSAMLDALDRPYLEFLHAASMNAGIYGLDVGETDPQRPHNEDELYVVLEGKAMFQVGDEVTTVTPGTLLYVRAGETHRFMDIEENLRVLVVFSKWKPATN